jgi:5'-nucleotidase
MMNSGETEPKSKLLTKNPDNFQKLCREISNEGADKLHLLLDYDGTVTHEWDKDGNPRPTLIASLRTGNYLSEEYAAEATALAAHYKAIEKDPLVEKTVKRALMQEWWEKHYTLLIKSRLNRNDIHKAMQDSQVQVRSGMAKILHLADRAGVPVVIMSANGLGSEAIRWHLQHNELLLPNIHIVSNELEWDEDGFMTGYRQPIVHSLNKDETVVSHLPIAKDLAGRPNIIQMGDSLGDIAMATGLNARKVLSIGFYNDKTPDRLSYFQDTFDAVIPDDSDAEELAVFFQELTAPAV